MKDLTRKPTPVDFAAHLGAVTRTVGELTRDGKPARNVTLARTYDTTPTDLWNAMCVAENDWSSCQATRKVHFKQIFQ